MTTQGQGSDKWFSIYVPESGSGSSVTAYESYFRLGGPDTTTEAAFVNVLKANYANESAQPAVQAAFGATPTGGIVSYTKGDVVNFVNGRSDTRVLNDSFVVHVLNKADVGNAGAPGATTPATTYRTYLRLGKPNNDIEKPLQGTVADAQLAAFVLGLSPPPPSQVIDATTKQREINAVLGGPVPAAGQVPDPAVTASVVAERNLLASQARNGDPGAIQAIEALRASADPKALVVYDGQTAKAWALALLQGMHLQLANQRRDAALVGDSAARAQLQASATGSPPTPPNPLARRKLVELAQSLNPAAVQSFQGQPTARAWATGALAALPAGSELTARWSLGAGVALYADQPITVTTPAALKVTVGSDTRTVLGPTYAETYDVSDSTIQQIKDGWLTQANQLSGKKLITATLTQRERSGISWRTTKFDQAKALTYSLSDSGTFGITSTYAFAAGLKLTNGVSASFDGSVGVAVSVPSSLKVELGKSRLETTWSGGKINFSKDQSLVGNQVKLSVGTVADFAVWPASETVAKVMRLGMVAVNVLVLAYTAAGVGIGNSTSGEGEDSTKGVREFLDKGEIVYITISVINAVFLAAGIVVGVIQLIARKAGGAAQAAMPAQPANILLNSAGIKLQCGASYLHMDATGVTICGPQVNVVGGVTNMIPAYFTGNMTAAQIAEAAEFATAFGLDMDALAAI